jgi:hypothetical protein
MFYAPTIKGRIADLSPTFRNFLEIAEKETSLTAQSLLWAWAECDIVRGKLLAEMQECPVLLTPVCAIPAFRHGERSWTVEGGNLDYLDAMRYTRLSPLGSPMKDFPLACRLRADRLMMNLCSPWLRLSKANLVIALHRFCEAMPFGETASFRS